MENPAYTADDDETRVSLRGATMPDHVTSADDLPPGEEIIEPVIAKTTASESESVLDPTRARKHSTDVIVDKRAAEKRGSVAHLESEISDETRDDKRRGSHASTSSRRPSAQSNTSRRPSQTPQVALNDEILEDDGFPWNPPKRSSHASIDMDATSITMHSSSSSSSSRRSSAGDGKDKKKKFACWHRMMKTLLDNRVQTEAAMQELILLDKMQDQHFRLCKKIMNVLFLAAGMILLLAVIVLIIYTDHQFNESMKALTVFLAGRRQGLW